MWLLLACAAPSSTPAPTGAKVADNARTIAGCPSFPADNVWNRRVDQLPPRTDSPPRMEWLADSFSTGLFPGACAGVWEGSRCGIPWNVVDETTPLQHVLFDGPWASGEGDFPIPVGYRIEGEPNPDGAWDRHVLIVDSSTCTLHELINVRNVFGTLMANGAARWDLQSNAYATEVWAGAEAAGLPMVPGIYSFEEVETGEIPHALRIALPLVGNQFVWPATHTDGLSDDPLAVPMGARLRLRADEDLSDLGPQAQVLATALQQYGAIVADTTVDHWALSGVPDTRWDDADLDGLKALRPQQFEWVDTADWSPEEGSMATKEP